MLGRYPPHATVAVSDLERAKAWYADKLELEPVDEDAVGAWYESGGVSFLLFPTPSAGTARNTVMEWAVDDVAKVVDHLKGRGVSFDTFEMDGITWEGEVAMLGEHASAWFRDSEGNVLAISD